MFRRVHGVWYVYKDFLFTLKGLFTRPGYSVREFIQGKGFHFLVLLRSSCLF
ncbi:MAG: DUF3667 domain-containing protein [Sphingobacteriaceae bacterium]|nr:DUF3667 domain-containing protein [Sphingobacteriaceae bacterium]